MKYVVVGKGAVKDINATLTAEENLKECVNQIINEIEDGRYRLYVTKINKSSRSTYVYDVFFGYYKRKSAINGWSYKDGTTVSFKEFVEIRKQFE
jgi:hypothetical protein